MFNKENNIFGYMFTIFSGILVGAGVSLAFYAGIIPTIIVLPIVTLIFSILSTILIALGYYYHKHSCVTDYLIASIVGAIISSSFALAATSLVPAAITSAILVGIVAIFLTVNIIFSISSFLCLISSRRKIE